MANRLTQTGYVTADHQQPAPQPASIQSARSPQPVQQDAFSSAPVQPPKRRRPGRRGLVLVLLLSLVILGTAGYGSVVLLGFYGNATQPPVTTIPLHLTVTYADVALTIVDAQQSQRFIDDANTGTSGMVRLHIQARNKTKLPASLAYTTIAQLALPNGTITKPVYVQSNAGVSPGKTQTSIVDFAVSTPVRVDQLKLVLGATDEAQLIIPLTAHADLSMYAPKTAKFNAHLQYLGLDWTLTSVTSQLSEDGQQASKGMRYLIVTLTVDNTLSQVAIPGSAYDYVRLTAGNTTFSPKNTTLPVSFEAGAHNVVGTVTFLVPQNATSFTLILSQSQSGFNQATTDFQLAV